MKINIANPSTGTMQIIDVDDEKKLRAFYDRRIGQEVDGAVLGDDFTGYVFRVSGGNDKQGFAMVQGVLTNLRVRLMLSKGAKTYRPRRRGERKRKSVRGCIVGPDLATLNLTVIKKGDKDIPNLTDVEKPKRLGPKRASKIRKLFNLTKADDVRKYVIARTIEKKIKGKGGEEASVTFTKRPKIQRLVTPLRVHRKKALLKAKKTQREKVKAERSEWERTRAVRVAEEKTSRKSRKSSRKASAKDA